MTVAQYLIYWAQSRAAIGADTHICVVVDLNRIMVDIAFRLHICAQNHSS